MISGRNIGRGRAIRLCAAGGLVGVAGGLLVLVGPTAANAATNLPVADSFVAEDRATRNYGSKAYLKADGSPAVWLSFLKFQVSGETDFSSAVLRVFVESRNSSSTGLELRQVVDNSWTESGITYTNAPAVGATVLDTTGPLTAGQWYDLDASSVVKANGTYSFALTTPATTAVRISSRESVNDPQLIVGSATTPPPPAPTGDLFSVTALSLGGYQALLDAGGVSYTGSVKHVVESAVRKLGEDGDGGTISFAPGTFDMGSEFLKLENIRDIVFRGAGMNLTVLRNSSDAAADTEPFNISVANRITIRDLQVIAGGAPRTTSDAIDGDGMNSSRIERVKITGSRGRGIVLDGKDITGGVTRSATQNLIKDCVISDMPSHGIELLAAQNNRVEGCTITNADRSGIQVNKASSVADQANKKASGNEIVANTVTGSGENGIAVNSSDNNLIQGNTVTNSSRLVASRDGIRIFTGADLVKAIGNRVVGNTATDTRTTKTQNYGLNILTALCEDTVVSGNSFAGNKTGPIKDLGTNTIYS